MSNFESLNIPNVSIFFDDLSRTELVHYIKNENFNKRNFLIADYKNFKKYLNTDEYPSHMDFLNSDISPDLLRFIKSKIDGGKNKSYYTFLSKIGEENLPAFSEEEVELIDTISELLPLVRPNEYLVIKQLIEGELDIDKLLGYNSKVTRKTLNDSLGVLEKKKIISKDRKLNVKSISYDLKLYLEDLCEYGLAREEIEFGEFEGQFKLYGNYYNEQIMMILVGDSYTYQKGTKFMGNGSTVLFVGIKKDRAKEERMNYKDKFLSSKVFQWESENNTTFENSTGKKILATKVVHLFVRKMDDEDGITLPFTYFGTGKFTNVRKSFVKTIDTNTKQEKNADTLLVDIILDNEVPVEYAMDFSIPASE